MATGRQETPQQLRAERTRSSLVGAARRVFAKQGYDSATIDGITQAAGCSKGAYYFHFASKEDVLLVLVDEWADSRSKGLQKTDQGRSPEAALTKLLRTLLSPGAANETDARLVLEFWSQAERNPKVRRRLARAYRSWRDLLLRAVRRAEETGGADMAFLPASAVDIALALHDGLLLRNCLGLSARSSWRASADALEALLAGARTARTARARVTRSVRAAS